MSNDFLAEYRKLRVSSLVGRVKNPVPLQLIKNQFGNSTCDALDI